MAHAFTNDIAADYVARRDALRARSAAACEFLLGLEHLAQEANGFHLGTAENLHLYLDDRYLAYVRFEIDPKKSPMMLLRAKPHIQIKEGTHDDSAALFDKAIRLIVVRIGGYKEAWAERSRGDSEFALTPQTPAVFFDELLAIIRALPRR